MDAVRRDEVRDRTLRLLQVTAQDLGELRHQRDAWPELDDVWAGREKDLLAVIGKCWDFMTESYRQERIEQEGGNLGERERQAMREAAS